MKIGVISDTHGNVKALRKALEYFEGVDMIVHAGDVLYHPPRAGCSEGYDIPEFVKMVNNLEIPVVIAQGNCDSQVYEELLEMPVQSPYAIANYNDVMIVVTHGHLLTPSQMIDMGKRYRADYFISGHTHVPVLEKHDSLVIMNPGSPSIPKHMVDGEPAPSVGLITDEGAKVINIKDGSTILELTR